jgi:hypothetical protein
LSAFRIIPDFRYFQLALYFNQLFPLFIEVKDTPSGYPHALAFL